MIELCVALMIVSPSWEDLPKIIQQSAPIIVTVDKNAFPSSCKEKKYLIIKVEEKEVVILR